MRIPNRVSLLLCTVIVPFLLLIGCTGPQGPAGSDATLPDTYAPYIEWVSPFGGETITAHDTIVVSAYDNSAVDSVHFYFDGAPLVRGTIAGPQSNYFRAIWNSNWAANGIHTLSARAYDPAGNYATTPTIIVHTRVTGIDTIQNFSGPVSPSGYLLPDPGDQSTEYAVELRTTDICSLYTVQFIVRRTVSDTAFTDSLKLYMYSKANNRPAQRIDSVMIPPDSLSNTGFSSHAFPQLLSANTFYYFSLYAPLTADTLFVMTDQTPRSTTRQDLYFTTSWYELTDNNIMLRAIVDIFE